VEATAAVAEPIPPAGSDPRLQGEPAGAGDAAILAGIVVFVSGFCALFYEVVWARALELVLGTSTWAFTLMLTTFLLGLSLGIWAGGRLARRGWSAGALWLVQVGVGLAVFATAHLLQALPGWFVALYARFADQPATFRLGQAGLATALLFVPACLIGTVFPLALELAGVARRREGRAVGRLYAVNTLGSILGAALAGLVLIPALGMHQSLLAGVWLNLGLAALVGALMPGAGGARRLALGAGPVALAVLLALRGPVWDPLLMTSGPFLYAPNMVKAGLERYRASAARTRLLYYREGSIGTVTVRESRGFRSLAIDGRGEGSTTASAQILLGHLPFAFQGALREIFVIGFGTGSTTGAVTRHPVERIDVVDLAPGVLEASRFFEDVNHRPLADPRVRVRIADARSVLLAGPPASYDLILSQPSHPWVPGAAKLFTAEFYALVRERLREGGLFAQWAQLYNLDQQGVATLLGTFAAAFPETLVVEVGGRSGELVLVGGRNRARVSWAAIERLFADPLRVRDLGRIGISNPGTLLARILLGTREIPGAVAGFTPNTDDNGVLEFASLGDLYRETTGANLARLRRAAANPWDYVEGQPGVGVRPRVLLDMARAALQARDLERAKTFALAAIEGELPPGAHRLLGDVLYAMGRQEAALDTWRQALRSNPGDPRTLGRLVRHYRSGWTGLRPPEYSFWVTQLGAAGERSSEDAADETATALDPTGWAGH
jgi:spermidine synthase